MNQTPNQYRFVWPPVTPSVIGLVVFYAAFWFATLIPEVKAIATTHFAVNAPTLELGYVWTLITYAFYLPGGFVQILFAGIALWLFGAELEKSDGPFKFWSMVILSALVGGLLIAAFQFLFPGSADNPTAAFAGANAVVMAFVTAYCRNHWTRQLHLIVIPMSGRTMLAVFFGLSVVLGIFSGNFAVIFADIAGVIVGWFAKTGIRFQLRDLKTRIRLWRARRRLKVVPKSPEDKQWIN